MNLGPAALVIALAVLMLPGCSAPAKEPEPDSAAVAQSSEDNLTPAQLTGIPVLDHPAVLELRVLYSRGSPLRVGDTLAPGHWLVGGEGGEFELSFHSRLVPDGIVRLGAGTHFLLEKPAAGSGIEARFRVYSGQVSFFLPPLSQAQIEVVTPSGTLVTPGGAFTVTISPDFQTLVTCREGLVTLAGRQNLAAWPGQVFQVGPWGSNRTWPLTPNQALVFQGRWLQIATDEAAVLLKAGQSVRRHEWQALQKAFDADLAELAVVWWRSANAFSLSPPSELEAVWNRAVQSRRERAGFVGFWRSRPAGESLLGDRLGVVVY